MTRHHETEHKFQHEFKRTVEEAYQWRFEYYVKIMLRFAEHFGRDKLIEMIKQAVDESNPPATKADPKFSLRDWINAGNEAYQDMMTWEIIEFTDSAYEMKVTECVWMETFKKYGACDIGYATICHSDFCSARAAHPGLTLYRSKSLMEGHDCCNHRWELKR